MTFLPPSHWPVPSTDPNPRHTYAHMHNSRPPSPTVRPHGHWRIVCSSHSILSNLITFLPFVASGRWRRWERRPVKVGGQWDGAWKGSGVESFRSVAAAEVVMHILALRAALIRQRRRRLGSPASRVPARMHFLRWFQAPHPRPRPTTSSLLHVYARVHSHSRRGISWPLCGSFPINPN